MDKPFAKVPRKNKQADFKARQKFKTEAPRPSSDFEQKIEKLGRDSAQQLREFGTKSEPVLKRAGQSAKKLVVRVFKGIKDLWHRFLKSFARWVDPKLDPYREPRARQFNDTKTPKAEPVKVTESVYAPVVAEAPQTRGELLSLMREVPMSVLSGSERKAVSAVLDLPRTAVAEIMTPVVKIVFVNQDETLGPLILDRLYRSGFTFFPVIDGRQHIIGVLSTVLLNSLDIKETSQAGEIMDPRVYYIRSDYSLEQALKAFLRTNSQMMLVVDRYEKLTGMLTFAQLMDYLFDEKYQDDFDHDNDRLAVAKRKLDEK